MGWGWRHEYTDHTDMRQLPLLLHWSGQELVPSVSAIPRGPQALAIPDRALG